MQVVVPPPNPLLTAYTENNSHHYIVVDLDTQNLQVLRDCQMPQQTKNMKKYPFVLASQTSGLKEENCYINIYI